MILSLTVNTDAAFFNHLLLGAFSCKQGCVWLGGCGFGLTTLKEFAPGLLTDELNN